MHRFLTVLVTAVFILGNAQAAEDRDPFANLDLKDLP